MVVGKRPVTRVLSWERVPVESQARRLHVSCRDRGLRLGGLAGSLGETLEAQVVLAPRLAVEVRAAQEAEGSGRKQSMKIHLSQRELFSLFQEETRRLCSA